MKRQYWTHPDDFNVAVNILPIGSNDFIIEPIVFHPEEGGQPSDKGKIGIANIISVFIKNGNVCVTLDRSLNPGKYFAEIDKNHRMDVSRQHTAQHIISAYAEKEFQSPTFGFHIGNEDSTIDLKLRIDWEQVEHLEKLANDIVMNDLKVETIFSANDKDLRIRSDILHISPFEDLRIVKISDLDLSACCGTHVSSTGKIGSIRIIGLESHKGGSRISFIAGKRVINYSIAEDRIIRGLKGLTTTSMSEFSATFTKMISQISEYNREINKLWNMLLPIEAGKAELLEFDGLTYGFLQTSAPSKLLTRLTALVLEKTNGTAIVIESKENPHFVIGSKTQSANIILKQLQEKIGGKGGGSPSSVSGTLPGIVPLHKIKEALVI